MLVLSRKQQESVVVGASDGLERMLRVTVLAIRGGVVRLGFEARSDLPIHRQEVWERVHAGRRSDRPGATPRPLKGVRDPLP
jgi:carbon storage regulator